jgi:hypothetical protein
MAVIDALLPCLVNYIGLQYASSVDPKSKLWVNSLPGISTELLENISSSDHDSYMNVWSDVQIRSQERLLDEILLLWGKDLNFNSTVYQSTLPLRPARNVADLPLSENPRGVVIDGKRLNYGRVFIRTIQFYSKSTLSDVVWKITDWSTQEVVEQGTVACIPGVNIIPVEKEIIPKFLDAYYFVSIESADLVLVPFGNNFYLDSNILLEQYGAYYNGVDFVRETGGVHVDYSIGCAIGAFLCQNLTAFKTAYWYLLGAEILKQKIGSFKTNVFTKTNKEATETLRTGFENQFTSYLKKARDAVRISREGVCFSCNPNKQVYSMGSLMP